MPAQVMALRRRQVKKFCCLLFLSNGTPMFRAGDEFMNTQFGNNNPYNQDNETGWLDWDQLRTNADIFRFFKNMIAFRKAHPLFEPEQVLAGGCLLVRSRPNGRFVPQFSQPGILPARSLARR